MGLYCAHGETLHYGLSQTLQGSWPGCLWCLWGLNFVDIKQAVNYDDYIKKRANTRNEPIIKEAHSRSLPFCRHLVSAVTLTIYYWPLVSPIWLVANTICDISTASAHHFADGLNYNYDTFMADPSDIGKCAEGRLPPLITHCTHWTNGYLSRMCAGAQWAEMPPKFE
ncbi:hypothetical protein J6590_056420 [Homalodisca vitripennis]|nr:hypothetical protein J6590_056420 [Homalodisca vitripennis]